MFHLKTLDKMEEVTYESPKVDQDLFAVALPIYPQDIANLKEGEKIKVLIGRLAFICICGKPKSERDKKEFCRNPKCFMNKNGKTRWWRDIL